MLKVTTTKVAILVVIFFSVNSISAPVNDVVMNGSQTQKKIQELTRLLENRNKVLTSLQNDVDQLSQSVNALTGNNDLLNYKLTKIENRQREIMLTISDLQSSKSSQKKKLPIQSPERTAYQKAVDFIIKSKNYDKAISAFKAFITDYPKSQLVVNSHYWLGQLYYKKKQFNEAKKSFLSVVNKFPKSNKRAAAILKVGVINEKLGYVSSAKKSYYKVQKEYPNSSPAMIATKKLKDLR